MLCRSCWRSLSSIILPKRRWMGAGVLNVPLWWIVDQGHAEWAGPLCHLEGGVGSLGWGWSLTCLWPWGVRRKATRSRSGCIFRERLPRMVRCWCFLLALLVDPPASSGEKRSVRGLSDLSVPSGCACLIPALSSRKLGPAHCICLMTLLLGIVV